MKDWHVIFLIVFVAIFGLLTKTERYALAATDVNEIVSSGTVGFRVIVTSGAAQRVDNSYGNGANIVLNRVGVWLQNHDSADNIYCAYDNQVSTIAGNPYVGWIVSGGCTGATGFLPCELKLPLRREAQLWCKAVDAAGAGGVNLAVMQLAKP